MTVKRILLVDDDVDFLEVNRLSLEAAGFEVLMAHNGEEGFKVALEGHPDAAVLDVMMITPDEGFQLARRMRKDERTRHIPLVMLTSVNAVNEASGLNFRFTDRDRDDMWMPVDKFLDKPVKPEVLVGTIHGVMRAT